MSEESKIVATGTWFYDRTIPKQIFIYARPAHLAPSRYDSDDQIDESTPIPETPDGLVYYCFPASSGDCLTLEEAKHWANVQPWGPVIWD
jgi:hypothetical protein